MSATNNSEQQQLSAGQKLWDIMARRKDMENMIQYMPAPKPVRDYCDFAKRSLEMSLETITQDKEMRISQKGQFISSGGVDFYKDYDYEDNTVYDAIKNAMDTIEAKCKPLEEAHAAKKAAMLLEIQKLREEEQTVREDMQKGAAVVDLAAARKRKKANINNKRAKTHQQPQ